MSEVTELTLDFLKNHPHDASLVLESMPPDTCAVFFQTIPPALAAGLIEPMPFDRAARLFAAMRASTAAAIIVKMNADDAAAALRLIAGSTRDRLLAELPANRKNTFRKQTQYPADTVGAWMDAFPIEIGETLSVGDTRRWLRQQERDLENGLFVIGAQGGVTGMIGLSQLALARNNLPVGKLMTTEFNCIQDRADLQSVRDLDDWERFDALPVVNHNQQFVGALTWRNLDKALSINGSGANSVKVLPLFGDIFKGFLEGMIQVVDWLSNQPRTEKDASRIDAAQEER
ncbi:MAG: magnesium transporter [Candidatus Nitrohelix vancouverensis]|uniref:Magnesium transporter n=1 Tax=Candidatus Nitrohelix vancouverensis TaxID=2705534 RepID=A0A7T0G2A5_9BACT|nr:MAG: magnesium transporter [Candidatus Nitrohelix vancouverensis]